WLKLSPLEELDRVAGLQLDDRLLPALLRTADLAAALRLRLHLEDVHAPHLDVEELLDRLAHLRPVRVVVHAERVLADGRAFIALLGDDRREQDLRGVHLLRPRFDERGRACVHMTGQGGPKGCLGDLAVHLLLEAARHLRERVTAAFELRGADRALAGTAGALLAPRLRAAAGDHAPALRLRGARS